MIVKWLHYLTGKIEQGTFEECKEVYGTWLGEVMILYKDRNHLSACLGASYLMKKLYCYICFCFFLHLAHVFSFLPGLGSCISCTIYSPCSMSSNWKLMNDKLMDPMVQAFKCLQEKGLIDSKPMKVDNVSQTNATGNWSLCSFACKSDGNDIFSCLNSQLECQRDAICWCISCI